MMTHIQTTHAKRILVKLSGESLVLPGGFGINPQAASSIAEDIVALAKNDIGHCLVVGGGNMFRGAQVKNMDRVTADTIGMLATVMNALALQQAIESLGQHVRVQSAVAMPAICEPYFRRRALRHLEKKRTLILAAGTGNPYFSTDTAAALRASELGCTDLFKATKVDGVYDKDPKKHDDAVRYAHLTFDEVSENALEIMDNAAIHLCKNNSIPITVFNVFERGALLEAAKGFGKHTLISHKTPHDKKDSLS